MISRNEEIVRLPILIKCVDLRLAGILMGDEKMTKGIHMIRNDAV